MLIETVRNVSQEDYKRELTKMHSGELIAQEIMQKGAMHVLHFILRNGPVTEQLVRETLEGLARQARWITEEARRRNLPTVVEGPAE